MGLRRPAPGGARGPTAVGEVLKLAALLKWLLAAALALVVIVVALRVLPRPRPAARVVVALALVLVAADLFRAGMGYNPAIPRSHAEQPTTDAIRYLQRQAPARFTGLKSLAPAALAQPLPPNTAMRYGIHDARGYVLPSEGRYFTLWRDAIAPSPRCYYFFCTETPVTTPRALHALGLLGVHAPAPERRRPAAARHDERSTTAPTPASTATRAALPRAFLVDRQVVVRRRAGRADHRDPAVVPVAVGRSPDRSASRHGRPSPRGRRSLRDA